MGKRDGGVGAWGKGEVGVGWLVEETDVTWEIKSGDKDGSCEGSKWPGD